jgi:hypothetical protein
MRGGLDRAGGDGRQLAVAGVCGRQARSAGQEGTGAAPAHADYCGLCWAALAAGDTVAEGHSAAVRPWAEVKSRRGRRKRAKTEGYACPNEECEYYGITDVY